ncbi:MAG: hypothetical protein Q7T41_01115 [Candidatus Saccharibacteria bacterium]|nr:hypothetical protein [Candidatus Saccharibacteria bacterium]
MQIQRLPGANTSFLITDPEKVGEIYEATNRLHIGIIDSLITGGGFPQGWQMPGGSSVNFELTQGMTKQRLSLVVQTGIQSVLTSNPLFYGNARPVPNEYSISTDGSGLDPETKNLFRLPTLQFYVRKEESELELTIFGNDDKETTDKLPVSLQEQGLTSCGYITELLGQFTTAQAGNGLATKLTTRLSIENTVRPSTLELKQ